MDTSVQNLTGKDTYDRGFSMVELIIVMAILGVVTGMFITGINLIFKLPSRQCARSLKAEIEKVRIDAMGGKLVEGKSAIVLLVYKTDEGVFYREEYEGLSPDEKNNEAGKRKNEKIGNNRVEIDWGGEKLGSGESNGKKLYFKRDTGGFDEGSDFAETILISSGPDTWKLTLHKLTGAVDLERSN